MLQKNFFMKLNIKIIIISIFMSFSFVTKGQYGKAYISDEILYEYEKNDIYYQYDNFLNESDFLDTALAIKRSKNNILIFNKTNNGFSGNKVEITISEDLNIIKVEYDQWFDAINGSESKYTVEKIILSLSSNPFYNKNISGYYILQIREDVDIGDLLRSEGQKDTTYYKTFHGKFKEYSKEEIEKGREWILDNYLKIVRLKDSLDIFIRPDINSKFRYDIDSIKNYLKGFKIKFKKEFKGI